MNTQRPAPSQESAVLFSQKYILRVGWLHRHMLHKSRVQRYAITPKINGLYDQTLDYMVRNDVVK